MKKLKLEHKGLCLYFDFCAEAPVHLAVRFDAGIPNKESRKAATPAAATAKRRNTVVTDCAGAHWFKWARLVELQATGFNQDDHHGNKYTGTSPADLLRYHSHRKYRDAQKRLRLEVTQTAEQLRVITHFEFSRSEPVFRSWVTVENCGTQPLDLEYVGSLSIAGMSSGGEGGWGEKMRLHLADNNWCGECQWRSGKPGDFGLNQFYENGHNKFGVASISVANQGSWSTAGALPLAVLENTATQQAQFWEIEHCGSWQWQISDIGGELCLRASGPTLRESLWLQVLQQGQTFTSIAVRFGYCDGGLEKALGILTRVRREQRLPHPDTVALPVIFNDYMNCLNADPSEEKQLPLVRRAAQAGCEYFVIDAGWYAQQGRSWWDTVGEWEVAQSRYPRGLQVVTEAIRQCGMVPGLWLEIEVMGIHCPLASTLPDDWFFLHRGKRVIDHGRYHLDFRNPAVRAYASDVIDRLIRDYRIGYIKMDYNINAGPGTDHGTDSLGAGLLEHSRAYIAWIESVLQRYPELVIENCGSGGLRMDSAMLRVHPVQSVTDQTDYRLNALIAAAACSAVPPEQAAVWSYPLAEATEEETIFNMVNSLLLRIHLSGGILGLKENSFRRVCEAITLYKQIRSQIPSSEPLWPLGLPRLGDGWIAYGCDTGTRIYLALWRLDSDCADCIVPLARLKGMRVTARCIYPQDKTVDFIWNGKRAELSVRLVRRYTARLFELLSASRV